MSRRPTYPSDLADKTLLRFPAGLKKRIEAEAVRNNRSLNAEIVERLEASFVADESISHVEVERQMLREQLEATRVLLDQMRVEMDAAKMRSAAEASRQGRVNWDDPEIRATFDAIASYAAREAVQEMMAIYPQIQEPPAKFAGEIGRKRAGADDPEEQK